MIQYKFIIPQATLMASNSCPYIPKLPKDPGQTGSFSKQEIRDLVPILHSLGQQNLSIECRNEVMILKYPCMNNDIIGPNAKPRTKVITLGFGAFDAFEMDVSITTFEETEEPVEFDEAFIIYCYKHINKGVQELTPLTYITVTHASE